MSIQIRFAWYDIWIGAYVDVKNKIIYICPLPMILFIVKNKD